MKRIRKLTRSFIFCYGLFLLYSYAGEIDELSLRDESVIDLDQSCKHILNLKWERCDSLHLLDSCMCVQENPESIYQKISDYLEQKKKHETWKAQITQNLFNQEQNQGKDENNEKKIKILIDEFKTEIDKERTEIEKLEEEILSRESRLERSLIEANERNNYIRELERKVKGFSTHSEYYWMLEFVFRY